MKQFSLNGAALVAASWATQARGALYGFPSRANPSLPITDSSQWAEGRYELTEVCFENQDKVSLAMNDVLVSIDRSNTIVKTALVGMEGTVKEHVGKGDYNITMTVGVVAVDEATQTIADRYPSEGVEQLRTFFDENRSIKVASPFFEMFDITEVVIEKFSLNQDTHSNRQVISISATSDKDYVLTPEY